MKRADILPILETLFANPPTRCGSLFRVCWFEEQLTLMSTRCNRKPDAVFDVLRKDQLDNGLDSAHWTRLEAKIVKFLRYKGVL